MSHDSMRLRLHALLDAMMVNDFKNELQEAML